MSAIGLRVKGLTDKSTAAIRRLRSRNAVPSRYEAREDGESTEEITIARLVCGPAFRSSHSDLLLQMADIIAHPLLKQEEEQSPRVERLGIGRAIEVLYRALKPAR